jgi:ABC-type multidrug transport system permease subunit
VSTSELLATPSVRDVGRPSALSLVWGQTVYCTKSFIRTPVAAFFTLLFPTTFLVVISAVAGNEIIDDRMGIRLAQFLAPVFAVFGICMASFVSLALGLAYAREAGVLKRLRGTPLPAWAHIAGRLLTAAFVSLVALVLIVGIGMAFYGVEIVWRTVPAVLLTIIVGVLCFAALGLAATALVPTPGATQAVTNGALILLAFISDIFVVELPDELDSLGWVFPLKHFTNAVADGFNPYLNDSGFYWDHLAVMAAWGVAGVLIALRFFKWEPHPARAERTSEKKKGKKKEAETVATPDVEPAATTATLGEPVVFPSPSWLQMTWGQARYAMLGIVRDPLSVFFAAVFPVLLLVFFSAIYGNEATWGGMPLPQYLAAAFAVYGVAVLAYVNLAGSVVEARSRLVLKRLRGTPLPRSAYLVGRISAAVGLGLLTIALILGVGVLLFGVRIPWAYILPTLVVFLLTVGALAALGLLLASLVDSPQSAVALALGTLLPLSMISDIFMNVGELPPVLNSVAWFFPLRHMAWASAHTAVGDPIDSAWFLHVGVILLWGVVAGLLAWRLFRWEPRR